METKMKNKYASALVFLCAAVYFVSYITRINYAAVLVEITKNLGISKTAASLALTASAVSYGFGQLVSGYLGDKIKPNKIIVFGLLCTAAMNLLIPLAAAPIYMTVIWFVNGFAQAMMWPPLAKIMISMLDTEEYKKGCVTISCASSVATIAMYLLAPVVIYVSSWRYVFVFSAVCAVLMCALWIFAFEKIKNNLKVSSSKVRDKSNVKTEKITYGAILLLGVIVLNVVIQGSLRDGVSNWMPSYVSETFNLGSEISILTNILLPVFSICTFHIVAWLNRRFIKNEYSCVTLFYAICAASALVLSLFGSKSAVIAILAAAVLNAASHGVNYCQTTLTPIYFERYGRAAFISGIINSGTYIGSAISTYGVAALTKSLSWEQIAIVWCVTALVGGIVGFAVSRVWKSFKNC